ncbi:MAG: hypothetical protein JNL97_10170 [Verrucomicrobiales bacterium]|nr:hypothetical protein [Verrucomicrobiales bacterium]
MKRPPRNPATAADAPGEAPDTPYLRRVRTEIVAHGPRGAFQRLIAENDALIRGASLELGRQIVTSRSTIYTEIVRQWAAEQARKHGYERPFAVVALGGTGRAEVTPCSDLDFAFLFDDALEGNPFLLELQRQLLHTTLFEEAHGFRFEPLPFNLDDAPRLVDKQLNSFVDLRPVHDPTGLAARFRERIRKTYDPFGHFLHVRGFWKGQWEKAAADVERLDQFDIKNDGLRVFLAGIWTLAGKRFRHSHEIYAGLPDPRDLDAYDFLLRIRCFVQLRHPRSSHSGANGNHPEDVLRFEDFESLGDLLGPGASAEARFEFGNEVRIRLFAARRRVARFAKAVIEEELTHGRETAPGSPIHYTVGGLRHVAPNLSAAPDQRSHDALALVLASQRYGVPIDPAELRRTFRDIGDWLVPVPELSALFYEQHGSLADSFGFLAQFDGAEDRLFPGYARFEASLDRRVLEERTVARSALERRKMRALEKLVRDGREQLDQAVHSNRLSAISGEVNPEIAAALLSADHLAGVKLALKTKRLPVTGDDILLRDDTSRPLHDRHSSGLSGIPSAEYFHRYRERCEFSEATLATAEFLVANRRAFKERAAAGMNPDPVVLEFAELCKDEQLLRSLYVFTCADRAEWDSAHQDPARWFLSRELYHKALRQFRPETDPTQSLRTLGFSPQEQAVLRDFGPDFYAGVYRTHAGTFGAHLLGLVEAPHETGPKAMLLRDGGSVMIGVAAADFRGLAACITGTLWKAGLGLRQAHLFSAMNLRLALDFFHVTGGGANNPGTELIRSLERSIREQRHIAPEDEAQLPVLRGTTTLKEWLPGVYCLQHETTRDGNGLVYALAYKVFRHLGGNIFGLKADANPNAVYVSIYLSLPNDLTIERARAIVAERF